MVLGSVTHTHLQDGALLNSPVAWRVTAKGGPAWKTPDSEELVNSASHWSDTGELSLKLHPLLVFILEGESCKPPRL